MAQNVALCASLSILLRPMSAPCCGGHAGTCPTAPERRNGRHTKASNGADPRRAPPAPILGLASASVLTAWPRSASVLCSASKRGTRGARSACTATRATSATRRACRSTTTRGHSVTPARSFAVSDARRSSRVRCFIYVTTPAARTVIEHARLDVDKDSDVRIGFELRPQQLRLRRLEPSTVGPLPREPRDSRRWLLGCSRALRSRS